MVVAVVKASTAELAEGGGVQIVPVARLSDERQLRGAGEGDGGHFDVVEYLTTV